MQKINLRKKNYLQKIAPFAFFGLLVGFAMYPIFVHPYFNKEDYSKCVI